MAKIAFSKFGLKPNTDVEIIEWGGQSIEILQYLPIQEKLRLIGKVISAAHEEDANYSNPVKIQVFTDLEIVFAYTNISFTEKQKSDLPKLYDLLNSSGLLAVILETIPVEEVNIIANGVIDSTEAIYKYQNSILGILSTLKGDMDMINSIDVEGMKHSLAELADNEFLKEIIAAAGLNISIPTEDFSS